MSGVPLCRASQALPFSSWLELQGVPAAPLLRKVGLPVQPEEIPDAWIAELPIWNLSEEIARSQGIEDFGLRVGLGTDVSEIGAFGRTLRAAATLRQALDCFLKDLNLHSSSSVFGLDPDGDSVWFWRRGIPGFHSDPIEQYALGLMLEIVRMAGGPAWAPDRVLLQGRGLPGDLAAETFGETSLQPASPVTALRFPASLLSARHRPWLGPAGARPEPNRSSVAAPDLVGSLRQALEPMLHSGAPDLHWAALAANTSPRTLRRRLRELGVTWSGLVEQTRFDTARRLLGSTDLRVAEVAREVGYADPANFTRAFRRWTGLAPRDYRVEA